MDYFTLKEMTNNWISTSNILPAEYEYVLVSYVDEYNPKMRYVPTIGCIKNNIWHTREGDIENDNLLFDYFKEHHLIPTHWMYLPNKPN